MLANTAVPPPPAEVPKANDDRDRDHTELTVGVLHVEPALLGAA